MNLRVLPGLLAWTFVSPFAAACGPFFSDTVLDKPQAALDVPPVSYLAELSRIAGRPCPEAAQVGESFDSTFMAQIPAEIGELRQFWIDTHAETAEIDRRIHFYAGVRKQMLEGLDATCANIFPTQKGVLDSLPVRPLGDEFPPEVSDYVEAARLHAIGQSDQARTLWKSILDRPIEQRRLRSVWAAWMLAKTSPDESECRVWYERVEKEAAAGGTDAIGLVAASMGWRAMLATAPLEKIRLYFDAFHRGQIKAARELRDCAMDLLASNQPEDLAAVARDPIARQVVNLALQASFDGPRPTRIVEGTYKRPPFPDAWLKAVEEHAKLPIEDGPRLAWALYSAGKFDEARHWLDLSPKNDPLSLWLQSKFDLRAGKLDAAQDHLAAAIRKYRSEKDWSPWNPYHESAFDYSPADRQHANQGRLLADAGLVALGREDYPAALGFLSDGGYEVDSAYIAEHLLSTDALLRHVRSVAPHASDRPQLQTSYFESEYREGYPVEIDPATCLQPDRIGLYRWLRNPDNRLRYQLGRRLAREGRFDEAVGFMPPSLTKLFQHYVALDRARHSKRYKGEALAAITWRLARIHRWWGAQLFSTDSFPDGGIHDWSYPLPDIPAMRAHQGGWSIRWPGDYPDYPDMQLLSAALTQEDQAIPEIRNEEMRRAAIPRVLYNERYHYRRVAADLAWEAAKLLPDGDPQLACLYNTAGRWAESVNPNAGNRFYEAMMTRCPDTDIARTAFRNHGFLRELESLKDLPGLLPQLSPKPLNIAWIPPVQIEPEAGPEEN